jgi:restriction system protein
MKMKGPEFLKYINPLIEILKKLGGSGNSSEVTDLVVEKMNIPEKVLEEKLNSGASRVKNQIAWARNYLVKSGYMDSSQRGIWNLTEKGLKVKNISNKEAIELFKFVQSQYTKKENEKISEISIDEIDENQIETEDNISSSEKFLSILQSLPPEGFERICQRILRESGFKKVIVTGKSGDGGIDGEGILEVNPLMSFKVLFQAKRYKGAVSSSQVRDFRGAMQGRADKGIIITTGRFTQEAKKEGIRDGAPPIELVDGEQLVKLFETNQLGLKPKTIYDIDESFFNEYR